MRHHDKRPPLRRAVHTESQWQTHIQECLRQDTRGMRRKARRADQNHESGNCGDEKTSEERITHRGETTYFGIAEMGHPQKLHRRKQRKAKSVEKFTKIWYNDINKTTKGRRYYVFIRLL